MSTTSPATETSSDVIETIFKDLRRAFDSGRTKPLAWREQQLEQLLKMCSEQKDAFAKAAHKDFRRPLDETLLLDCASVGVRQLVIHLPFSVSSDSQRVYLCAQSHPRVDSRREGFRRARLRHDG